VTGERYYVTYLTQDNAGSLAGIPTFDGIFLHRVRETDSLIGVVGRDSFSAYIPWSPYEFGAGEGVQWVSTTRSLSILIVDLDKDRAILDFSFSETGSLADTTGPAWQAEPTVVQVKGKRARVRVVSSWDQSGVAGHFISVNGNRPQPIGMIGGVGTGRTVSVPLAKSRNRIEVTARDLAGNTTVWTKIVKRKR